MTSTRRAFIKSAAILPAAAAAAPLMTAEAMPTTSTVPPVPPTPYNDHPWQWWVGHDRERFSDCFNTREDALEAAEEEGYRVVAECKSQDYTLDIEGGDILEMIQGSNEDRLDEDGECIDCTDDQCRDLGDMVTRAVEEWVMKHNISIRAWAFGDVRNEMDIPRPALACAQDKHE
jgi:hypothetical protein